MADELEQNLARLRAAIDRRVRARTRSISTEVYTPIQSDTVKVQSPAETSTLGPSTNAEAVSSAPARSAPDSFAGVSAPPGVPGPENVEVSTGELSAADLWRSRFREKTPPVSDVSEDVPGETDRQVPDLGPENSVQLPAISAPPTLFGRLRRWLGF